MSDAASLAAAATADRDDQDSALDVESAADVIERLFDRRRRDAGAPEDMGADGQGAAAGPIAAAADAGEPLVRVRLGAEEHEMPLSELAALYDQLMTADSDEPAESLPQTASPADHEAFARQLAALAPALQQELQAFAGVNWARMAAEDPALYAQARPAFDALSAQLSEVEAAQSDLAHRERRAAAAHVQRLGAERDALAAKVPEFADPQRAAHEATALLGYLAKAGYQPHDIDALTDHRHVVMARKAMMYDRLTDGRARVAETVKALPRVQMPGTAPERHERGAGQRGALMQRLRRSGRVEDAARLIEDLI